MTSSGRIVVNVKFSCLFTKHVATKVLAVHRPSPLNNNSNDTSGYDINVTSMMIVGIRTDNNKTYIHPQ